MIPTNTVILPLPFLFIFRTTSRLKDHSSAFEGLSQRDLRMIFSPYNFIFLILYNVLPLSFMIDDMIFLLYNCWSSLLIIFQPNLMYVNLKNSNFELNSPLSSCFDYLHWPEVFQPTFLVFNSVVDHDLSMDYSSSTSDLNSMKSKPLSALMMLYLGNVDINNCTKWKLPSNILVDFGQDYFRRWWLQGFLTSKENILNFQFSYNTFIIIINVFFLHHFIPLL